MPTVRIFLVHGRDDKAVVRVKKWFAKHKLPVDLVTLADDAVKGELIPTELERIARTGDAAIVLATPDDEGALLGSASKSPRARQNVWLEAGWFWARLGRRRTLLLLKGDLERPSDTDGILYLPYKKKVQEVGEQLKDFVNRVTMPGSDGVTEVIATDAKADGRSAEYQMVFDSANSKVLVSGVGMANVRNALPRISQMLLKGAPWVASFLVPNRDFLRANSKISTEMYRSNIEQDVGTFCSAVEAEQERLQDLGHRLTVWSFDGMMTFSATVADIGIVGSLMAVETVLPVGGEHVMARPRLLLRRRTEEGLYDRYARALEHYMERSRQIL